MDTAVSNLRVLVVDDDDTMRQLMRRMLTRMNARGILTASGGDEALSIVENAIDPIDIVIADWNMPGMSGLELFGRIRAIRPRLPFLLLTGRDDARSIIAAKTTGVPAYLVKPVSPHELHAKIAFVVQVAA
jgi:DNA-binding response OmpR family regulator